MSKPLIMSLGLFLGACQQEDLLVGTWKSSSIAYDSNLAYAYSELVFRPRTRETPLPDGREVHSQRLSAIDRLLWTQQSPTTPGCSEIYRLSSESTSYYSNAGYGVEVGAREPGLTVERSGCLRAADDQPAIATTIESPVVAPSMVALISRVISEQVAARGHTVIAEQVAPTAPGSQDGRDCLIPSRLDENELVMFAGRSGQQLTYSRVPAVR